MRGTEAAMWHTIQAAMFPVMVVGLTGCAGAVLLLTAAVFAAGILKQAR